jgi:hypothetical protein
MYALYCEHCGQFQSSKSVQVPTAMSVETTTYFPCGRSVTETWNLDGSYKKDVQGTCRGFRMMDGLPTDKLSHDDIPF